MLHPRKEYFIPDIIDNIDKLANGRFDITVCGVKFGTIELKNALRKIIIQRDPNLPNMDIIDEATFGRILEDTAMKMLSGPEKENIMNEISAEELLFDVRREFQSGILLICRHNTGFSIRPDYTYSNLSKMAFDMFGLIKIERDFFAMPLDMYRHASLVNSQHIEGDKALIMYFATIYPKLMS